MNKDTVTEPLPCPFCGGEVLIVPYQRNGLNLKCKSCLIGIKQRVLRNSIEWLREKMIEGWNKRTPPNSDTQEQNKI